MRVVLRNRLDVVPEAGTPDLVALSASDFTYEGNFLLPENIEGVTRFSYSTAALSGRVVDGNTQLFITGAAAETGWNDPIYEISYPGVGNRATLINNYGDVASTRVSQLGNAKPIRGLLWDDETQRLLWAYMDQHNTTGYWDPSIGSSAIDGGVVIAGPWRTGEHSKRTGGYMVKLPTWLQTALGGKKFASGAPVGSGNAGSPWGVFLTAWSLPTPSTPADTTSDGGHVTMPVTTLIYCDINNPQPRSADADECGWTHYGESDSFGDQPQNNPTQDGSGCTPHAEKCGASFGARSTFFAVDTISSAVWIEGAAKHGFVAFGQLVRTIAAYSSEYGSYGRCHAWYGPSQDYGVLKLCAHGQNDTRYASSSTGPGVATMQGTMFIYDPADIADVVNSVQSSMLLPPVVDGVSLTSLPHSGSAFHDVAGNGYNDAGFMTYGAWFEPVSKKLFLAEAAQEWQGEWRPVIHVFSVDC